jgi:hypothetical protein
VAENKISVQNCKLAFLSNTANITHKSSKSKIFLTVTKEVVSTDRKNREFEFLGWGKSSSILSFVFHVKICKLLPCFLFNKERLE